METAVVASDHITISITLIWTVVGALVTALGILGKVIVTLYRQNQDNQKAFTQAILNTTSEVMTVTRDNSDTQKALTKSVQELPDKLLTLFQKQAQNK